MRNYTDFAEMVSEFFHNLFGYRKAGAFNEDVPKHEIKPVSSVKKLKKQAVLDAHGELAWENFYNQFQGKTPWCVAFTIAHVLSYMLTARYSQRITIDGNHIAEILIAAGILTKEGASIRDSVKYITTFSQQIGIKDNYGVLYEIMDCEAHERSATKDLLLKGYPIVFGDMIGAPMCDSRYVLRNVPTSMASGHAFMGAPSKKTIFLADGTECMNCENSWSNWGIPYLNRKGRSGQFHVEVSQLKVLFTPWIFTNVLKK